MWRRPDGWLEGTLADVGGWASGGTPTRSESAYFGGGIPWLKIGDLNDGVVTTSSETITSKGLSESAAKLLPPGVLLVAMYGSIGKLGITGIECATNQAIASCVPDPDIIDLDYFFWFMRFSRGALHGIGKGGNQQNISQTVLKEFPIAVPPLPEQRRRVERIRALADDQLRARGRLERCETLIRHLRLSVLQAACTGNLTASDGSAAPAAADESRGELAHLPQGWTYASVQELCDVDRAITYGVIKLGPTVEGGVATLRSSNVRFMRIDTGTVKTIAPDLSDEYRRTILQGGEVLVTVRGTLGGVAVAPPELAGANISREVAVLPTGDGVSPDYLMCAVAMPQSQRWLAGVEVGATYTGVNIRDLKRLPIPLPPMSTQLEIVRAIRGLFRRVDALDEQMARHRARLEQISIGALGRLLGTQRSLD